MAKKVVKKDFSKMTLGEITKYVAALRARQTALADDVAEMADIGEDLADLYRTIEDFSY